MTNSLLITEAVIVLLLPASLGAHVSITPRESTQGTTNQKFSK